MGLGSALPAAACMVARFGLGERARAGAGAGPGAGAAGLPGAAVGCGHCDCTQESRRSVCYGAVRVPLTCVQESQAAPSAM